MKNPKEIKIKKAHVHIGDVYNSSLKGESKKEGLHIGDVYDSEDWDDSQNDLLKVSPKYVINISSPNE
jgi:hypothetical protein